MDVVELTRQLVGIDSQNPGPYEGDIARSVLDWARERDFETQVLEPVPGRPNVVITVDRGGPESLGLSGHLDTKPIGDALAQWRTPPLELTIDGDTAYGLGATDMKGAIAAMMVALERFAAAPGTGRVSLILTADEEQGSDAGAKVLTSEGLLPPVDAIVIGEPSGISAPWEAVHLVSRGICCFEVDVLTNQGHSGLSPQLGRSAVLIAADLLRAFESFEPSVSAAGEIPCRPTVNPGVFVSGGVSYGTWPGRCTLGMEIRLVPGMDRATVEAEVHELVSTTLHGKADFGIRYLESAQGWMAPVSVSPSDRISRAAQAAASDVLGREVPFAAFPGSTDATYFIGRASIPSITSLGPGWISVAHGANESVGVSQLYQAADIYSHLIARYFENT